MVKIFGHYISVRSILIATFEFALILAVYDLAGILTRSLVFGQAAQPMYGESGVQLAFCVLFWLTALACGMYSAETITDVRDLTGQLLAVSVLAYFVTASLLSVMELLFNQTVNLKLYYAINLGAAVAYYTLALLFRLNVFARRVTGSLIEHRVLVVGAGDLAGQIARLEASSRSPFSVSAFIPISPGTPDAAIPPGSVINSAILESPAGTLGLAREHAASEIVFASRERRGMPIEALMECKLGGLIITGFSEFWERQAGQIDLNSLNPGSMIFSSGFRMSWQGRILKRLFDLALGSLLLIVTLPISIATAIAIKLDSPGPILYRQERVGLHGRPFWILKFRSMRQDAEKDGKAVWAQRNDSRVTRVGQFIRRTRIDEIPQVLNVLAGAMSFAGPRPERPQFVEELSKKIQFYEVRHQLKPGITGWAQINLPYGASDEDAKAKLAYDLYYVKNWNLFLDIVIIIHTVQVVLWRMGAR